MPYLKTVLVLGLVTSTSIWAAARPRISNGISDGTSDSGAGSITSTEIAVKPKPTPTNGTASQAAPFLPVVIKPMNSVTQFPLLGVSGGTVDLTTGLSKIFLTEVSKFSRFQPTTQASGAPLQYQPCGPKIIRLSAEVPVLTMSDSAKLTIGYNSSGVIHPLPGAVSGVGVIDLHIGYLRVDVKLELCDDKSCSIFVASSVDATIPAVHANFKVDVGNFSPEFDLLFATDLNKRISAAMDQALVLLAQDSRISLLPWQTTVYAVDAGQGVVRLASGASSGIGVSQAFTAYQPVVIPGDQCPIESEIGTLRTIASEIDTSQAVLDDPSIASRIKVGDIIKVHPVKN